MLVELEDDRFRHEHLGQLNAYVAWYKRNEMAPGGQPPIGILLCTEKNHELVEFASTLTRASKTASLEFLTAAAWTRLIAAYLIKEMN